MVNNKYKEEVQSLIFTNEVEKLMLNVRGQNVLLDRDVAMLYGVETRIVNQAVKNNPLKFPEGYIIELDEKESSVLRSKILTLEQREGRGRHSKYNVKAFTEKGLYMLATILKSPRAVEATLAIIDTFTMTRQLARTMESLQTVEDGGEQQKSLLQKTGEILADIVGNNLSTADTETEIELNFAVVKIKHKVVRKRKE
ncbi:MAG: ORF6N domain-containing protein [Paludibacteraceae bacterium]|nr:ORF6N domain-containing protein [Paludibacteraceae bacterium]